MSKPSLSTTANATAWNWPPPRRIAADAGVRQHLLPINTFSALGGNALTDAAMAPETGLRADGDSELPNTFVPGRNLIFLTFAAALAWQRQLDHRWWAWRKPIIPATRIAARHAGGAATGADPGAGSRHCRACAADAAEQGRHRASGRRGGAPCRRWRTATPVITAPLPPCGECAACQLRRARLWPKPGVEDHAGGEAAARGHMPLMHAQLRL